MSPSVSRLLLIVALGLVLMVPSAAIAGPARVLPAAQDSFLSPGDVLTQVWSLVSSLWEKAGCKIDPNGLCVAIPSPTFTSQPFDGEAGCKIDPSGYCVQ
jgi:hypothetical protein